MVFPSFADEIQASVSAIGYPGVAILVMHGGKISAIVGVGSHQSGGEAPFSSDTLFEQRLFVPLPMRRATIDRAALVHIDRFKAIYRHNDAA
jgi:hypothetical protein